MLSTFSSIKSNFKFKPSDISIDNLIFKLHYRVTTLLLLTCTILVTSRQYIGEHIHCISDSGVATHVMNTYCFFTTTFTVERHLNSTLLEKGAIPHLGVGPLLLHEEEEIHHNYYQWVPFVLFGQALAFYAPHFVWKSKEGLRIRKLVEGLKYSGFSFVDKEVTVKDKKVPAVSKRDDQIELIKKIFIERRHVDKTWSLWLVFCEMLNGLNVVLQVYLTNKFLAGRFYSLGPEALASGQVTDLEILDIVFPKVTKCTFHKYGPTGTIQAHDAMCVMALNIINEKIYLCLWFWYVILATVTLLGLVWRGLTVLMHSRSQKFNRFVFNQSCPGKLNPWEVLNVSREFHFSDWLFLYYLSKNLDGFTFKKLFIELAKDMEDVKPLINIEDEKSA